MHPTSLPSHSPLTLQPPPSLHLVSSCSTHGHGFSIFPKCFCLPCPPGKLLVARWDVAQASLTLGNVSGPPKQSWSLHLRLLHQAWTCPREPPMSPLPDYLATRTDLPLLHNSSTPVQCLTQSRLFKNVCWIEELCWRSLAGWWQW